MLERGARPAPVHVRDREAPAAGARAAGSFRLLRDVKGEGTPGEQVAAAREVQLPELPHALDRAPGVYCARVLGCSISTPPPPPQTYLPTISSGNAVKSIHLRAARATRCRERAAAR